MRVNKIFRKEGCTTPNILLWFTFVIYVILISFFSFRHENWLDEWHVWFMTRDTSFLGMFEVAAHDGHFFPWFMLVFPFAKLGIGFISLEFLSCFLCALGALFLLFKAPFSYFSKVLILFSFPMLYSFSVLARCYALIPPIIFVIGYLYQRLPNHKYLYCFFVGLLSLTHSYMEGMVGALFVLYCYDYLLLPYKRHQVWKQNLGPAILTCSIVIIALMHMIYASHIAIVNEIDRVDTNASLVGHLFDSYAIQPALLLGIKGAMTTPNFDLIITLAVWLVLIICLYKCFRRDAESKRLALVGFVSIAYMIVFATSIYFMVLQRLLLPVLVIISLLWCCHKPILSKYTTTIMLCLFAMTSFNHYGEIKEDVNKLYCNAEKVSDFIHETIPNDATIAQGNRFGFIYELLTDYRCYDSDIKSPELTDEDFDLFAEAHSCETFYPVCMSSHNYSGDKYNFECLYDGDNDEVIYYKFFVYKVSKKEINE